jgi:SWI/SNF-related matrix-associated actin-dependent regulator 1 of chromatin subfamily A
MMQQPDPQEPARCTGLHPHQIEGVAFLMRQRRAIPADGRGLGKTRQAILAMGEAQPKGTVLVVCPTVLALHWHREILLADPAARVEVVGTRAMVRDGPPGWVVVHYDLLAEHAERLRAVPWGGVILDEAHGIGGEAGHAGAVMRLLGIADDAPDPMPDPSRVYLLTGASAPGRPRDVYDLLRCIGHPAARSFRGFARRYCMPGEQGRDARVGAADLLWRKVMLRRTRDGAPGLPPRICTWVPVEVGSSALVRAQQRFLGWLEDTAAARLDDRALLGEWQRVRLALHKAKHHALSERIRNILDCGEKVVVCTTFPEGAKRHAASLGAAAVIIGGEGSMAARLAAMHAFQTDATIRVAICIPGGDGLHVPATAAAHMIFHDLDCSPANLVQAEDRAHPRGEAWPLSVEYLFGAGTLDQHMADILASRLALVQAPAVPVLRELETRLRPLAATLLAEPRPAMAACGAALRIAAIGAAIATRGRASRGPNVCAFTPMPKTEKPRRLGHGRDAILACTCPAFGWRGECTHLPAVHRLPVLSRPRPAHAR